MTGQESPAAYQWGKPESYRMLPLHVGLLAVVIGLAAGAGIVLFGTTATVVVLLLLAFGLAVFTWPELGVLAFIAVASLLPFAVLPVQFVFNFTLVDVTLTTLLAAWLFWAVQRERPIVSSVFNTLVCIYLGFALVSFLLGLTYSISPERLRLFMKSINSTLLFFGALNCVRTWASLRRAIIALLMGGWAAAGIALALLSLPEGTVVQLLSALGPLGYPTGPEALRTIADTRILRAIGTSIDPNVLGGLLMMASALLAGQVLSPRPLLDRWMLWLMLATTVVALMATQSRSAMGGLAVGVLIVAAVRDRRVVVLMLSGMAILLLFPDVVSQVIPQARVIVDRLHSGLAFQDRAAAMRLDEYANALNTISRYPWFGIGFGEPPSVDLYLGVSSIYLLIGQEMGLIGLSSFLAVLGMVAWRTIVGFREAWNEEIRGALLSLGAAMGAAAAAGLLDHYYVNIVFPHMVGLFWLYVGLTVVASRLATSGPYSPRRHEGQQGHQGHQGQER